MSGAKGFALVVHGGAGARPGMRMEKECARLKAAASRGQAELARGVCALDVAVSIVAELEDSGLYIAGRGASPNRGGRYELDASVMDGETLRAGAVAALSGFRNPVRVARHVMEETPHVLLAAEGAEAFARNYGFEGVEAPETWYTRAGADEANHAGTEHGTVGCCVLDACGRLAASSSTAGLFDKMPGRVADTPLIGAGLWCDDKVAVACTGQGDYFIRTAAAVRVAIAASAPGASLQPAVCAALDRIVDLGGWGGLVALSRQGEIIVGVRKFGVKYAALAPDGRLDAGVMFPDGAVQR
ncbi:MAG: isoaspartyl peptidase/L-asparaginase [Hyphomonadaceae bacterium]